MKTFGPRSHVKPEPKKRRFAQLSHYQIKVWWWWQRDPGLARMPWRAKEAIAARIADGYRQMVRERQAEGWRHRHPMRWRSYEEIMNDYHEAYKEAWEEHQNAPSLAPSLLRRLVRRLH